MNMTVRQLSGLGCLELEHDKTASNVAKEDCSYCKLALESRYGIMLSDAERHGKVS